MSEWKKVRLGDVVSLVIDHRGKTPKKLGGDWAESGYRALSAKTVKTRQIVNEDSIRFVGETMYREWMKDEIQRGDILVTSEAPYGEVYYWDSDEKIVLSQRLFGLRIKPEYDSAYVAQYMTTTSFKQEMDARATGTTVFGLRQPELLECKLMLPPLPTQHKIAAVLGTLDDKVENNRKICANLEAQAQALFKTWFVDNSQRIIGRKQMQDVFNVSIGRTPPRKEFQWFSEKKGENIVWVSIADMGSCGAFISDSSEYLTPSAIERFNFKMVERGAVLLSFKLTVGRVAIADAKLVTNEAIAQLSNRDERYREYLYCYLRQFEFDKLGSTSSIATAVNSATIREMPFLVPNEDDLSEFHLTVYPMFEQIRMLLRESRALAATRDALLPKLMSGEIDVEKVEV